ncbi:MAG TPA: hypothetical protein VH592_27025 [Gemmataceae bacterium]|jgi:hypothetical protein
MNVPQTSTAAENTGTNGANGALSADVVAFAREHQGEHCLLPLLEATHRIFPTARFVKVSVVEDPELRDNTQIVFHVQVVGLPSDQARTASDQWYQEKIRLYPPLRKILFCLRLDLRR